MKRPSIHAALLVLTLASPAAAQGYEPGTLPPHEIVTMLRSTGLDPIGQPVRRGPNYVLRAIDDNDREVRVVVGARSGEVRSVTPIQTASRTPPPGGSFGPYERMPSGYTPPDGYRPGPGGPPIAGDDEGDDEGNAPPRPYGARPPATPPRAGGSATLPPRGGAMAPDDDEASLPEPNVMADPNHIGVLPPPPERFPQRAAQPAPAKPKPVKRTAAIPKPAPLPKAKPSSSVETLPPPQSTPPAAWPESKPADDAPLPN